MTEANLPGQAALDLLRINHLIWQMEDKARSVTASTEEIANLKRSIDVANQKRNDLIEKFDHDFYQHLVVTGKERPSAYAVHDSESLGSMVDKLAIMEIRQHYLEQLVYKDSDDEELTKDATRKRLVLLNRKSNFCIALQSAIDSTIAGMRIHESAQQLKLYNDPRYNPNLKE